MLDFKVMHSLRHKVKIIFIFFIFQPFLIKNNYADHLNIKLIVNKSYQAEIIIEGYDRKYLFEERNGPLFIINKSDIDINNNLSIKSIPHLYIGIFAFADLDGNKKFTLDFKGNPTEPYGFSLNSKKKYKEIKYEDVVFDTGLVSEDLEIKIN